MMTTFTHLLAFALGVVIAGAYARRQIAEIKRRDVSPRQVPSVPHSIEDALRRAGC